jgi:hypothetical protein
MRVGEDESWRVKEEDEIWRVGELKENESRRGWEWEGDGGG